MYIKSENLQALQSQQMISKALLSLMNIHPYDDITITQICQEAQVVRQTFYRNFEAKIDILDFYLDNIVEDFLVNHFDCKIDMYQQFKVFFEYLLQYKDFFMLVEKNNLLFLLNKTLTVYISKFSYVSQISQTIKAPNMDMYVLGFIVSTISSIISLWVKNNFEESPERLANLARIFLSGLENTKTRLS